MQSTTIGLTTSAALALGITLAGSCRSVTYDDSTGSSGTSCSLGAGGCRNASMSRAFPSGTLAVWSTQISTYAPPVTNTSTPLGMVASNGFANAVTFGPSGWLYVADNDNDSASWVIEVFTSAVGGKLADRRFEGPNQNLSAGSMSALAIDRDGHVYAASRDGVAGSQVQIFSPDANGKVDPERTILFDGVSTYPPMGMGMDADGNLFVGLDTTVAVYAPGAEGHATPLRTLGPFSPVNHFGPLSIAVDADGRILLPVQDPVSLEPSIDVFDPGASGAATPGRRLVGSKTTLTKPICIAVAADGTIYVGDVAGTDANHNRVLVFPPGADGNMAPSAVVSTDGYDVAVSR